MPGEPGTHFGGSTAPILGHTVYIALTALVLNLIVTIVLTAIFRAARVPAGTDETVAADYTEDLPGEPAPVLAATAAGSAGPAGVPGPEA